MPKDLHRLRIDREKRAGQGTWWRWWPLALLLVVGLFLAGWYFWLGRNLTAARVAAPADPTPAPLQGRPSGLSGAVLVASGYIVAHHKIEVGSRLVGKVQWIGVEKGDQVRKGDLLVKLDDREQRAQLAQAQATLRLAEAQLAELEAGNRPEEIERAEAELERAQVELRQSQLDLQRLTRLERSQVISRQDLDNARSRFEMARANLKVAEQTLQLLRLGPRREQIERARAEVERARATLQLAKAQLEDTEIRAPITGVVLARLVETGEMVSLAFAGGAGVVALADLNDLQVELDISQTDFKKLQPELGCRMTPQAYPDRVYPCRIAEISPEADRQRASIQVKVQILQPDAFLRPEMDATVTFYRLEGQSSSSLEGR